MPLQTNVSPPRSSPPVSAAAAQANARLDAAEANSAAVRAAVNTQARQEGARVVPPPPYAIPPITGGLTSGGIDLLLNRPSLPEIHRNPFLQSLPMDAHLVKFQTIVRENKEIIVGRVKVPVPGQTRHAFILRRYDTDAISLTTMFKVAFPGATDADEKREEAWIVSNFDTRGTNGGRDGLQVRLAGLWVSRHLAIHLATAYNVSTLVAALARAVPDPMVEYRMSQRSVAAQQAAERQRGAANVAGAHARANANRANGGAAPATAAAHPNAPAPKRQRQPQAQAAAPSGDRTYTLEATTTITAPVGVEPHMEAEIAAAKQLVLDLKEELRLRNAAGLALTNANNGAAVVAESSAAGASRPAKRSADEGEATGIPAGLANANESRVIRRNKRVEVQGGTPTQTAKKVAWSAFVFGLGFAASTLLPSFASAYL